MSSEPIAFYFDFNSPYGYIAACRIGGIAAKHGRGVDWNPILLRSFYEVTGTRPLAQIPLKGGYMLQDFGRSAKFHGVDYRQPDNFPFSPVAASRAVYWAKNRDPQKAGELALALYHACSRDNADIAGPEGVAEIAGTLGFDGGEVMAALADEAVKQRLSDEVDAALAKGVFGSPYFIIDGEPFWGADRLTMVEEWLATGGW